MIDTSGTQVQNQNGGLALGAYIDNSGYQTPIAYNYNYIPSKYVPTARVLAFNGDYPVSTSTLAQGSVSTTTTVVTTIDPPVETETSWFSTLFGTWWAFIFFLILLLLLYLFYRFMNDSSK